jgi:hypothetical protein
MPTNLPTTALHLWEETHKAVLASGKTDDEATSTAWLALQRDGWVMVGGEWQKSPYSQFSLTVKRASIDEATGQMRWRADASDTVADLYNDNMSLELYQDFLSRIASREPLPEGLGSEFWNGGVPYLSISHYDDMNGAAVPGEVESVYVDGKFLKAKGTFHDNSLGKACFRSLVEDIQQYKSGVDHDGRVRVSISFLDWKHMHKHSGYVFERKSITDICPECLSELISGQGAGKIYLRGHLIHLALTRVPVNTRALMEVDDMTTRKQDAASIVGEELAEELDSKSKAVKSMAIVEMSESEDEPVLETPTDDLGEVGEEVTEPVIPATKTDIDELKQLIEGLASKSVAVAPAPAPHALDTSWQRFRAAYDNVVTSEDEPEQKLRSLQTEFDVFAEQIISSVRPKSSVVESESAQEISAQVLAGAISQALAPLAEKLDLLTTQLSATERSVPKMTVPAPRSIPPTALQAAATVTRSETPKLRALLEKQMQSG